MPQLLSLRSRAGEPQLLSPRALEPVLRNKGSHCSEKPTRYKEEKTPLAPTRKRQQQRLSTVKNKINYRYIKILPIQF